MSTAGKRALVTGGSAGLGAACVRWLRAHDFHVVSLDRNPAPSGDTGQIGDSSPSHYLHCDLSDRAQLDEALGGIIAEGPFDLLVLNAGISATGRFEAIGLAGPSRCAARQHEAPMVIAARLLEAQALRPGAAMVFVSSLSHFTGYPGAASYGASKDALAVFAKGHAQGCESPWRLDHRRLPGSAAHRSCREARAQRDPMRVNAWIPTKPLRQF
jgi:NAD(P)-dependent dehydrogenase (short-subunit alcohol dehydrogenase family)